MKITDPDVIKNGEQDLIEAVTGDLDLEVVKQILKERLKAAPLKTKGGEIVVHQGQIAFRLDFDLQLSGSLLFDRKGNYITAADTTGAAPSESLELELDEADAQMPDPVDMDLEPEDLVQEEDLELEENPDQITETIDLELDQADFDPEDAADIDLDEAVDADPSPDTVDLEDEDLSIDLPEYDEDESLDEEDQVPQGPEDLPGDELLQEKMLDDDISDIIKESREFWEQKKNS